MGGETLKPCPFCGGEAKVFHYSSAIRDEVWRVVCDKPFCVQGPDGYTEAEAIAAWNSRADRTCRMEYQTEGMQRGWWKCSECGEAMDTIKACGGRKPPRWCGNCGRKVVDA